MEDVDTDLIIPAQYLTSISRGGFGANVFRRLRDADPNFSLNLPRYSVHRPGAVELTGPSKVGAILRHGKD